MWVYDETNWKRTLQGALLGAVLLAMAGCGSTNVMDTYSFGHQVIRAGQSEITTLLPYEMGKKHKNMSDDGYPIDIYGSVTEHMVIEVEALRPGENKPLPTVDEYVNCRSKSEFTKVGGTIKEESVAFREVHLLKSSMLLLQPKGKHLEFLNTYS